MTNSERLQKIISRAGIASRRAAEELITAGKVRVNGVVVTELGAKASPDTDRIEVDGRTIDSAGYSRPEVFILLNKPRGVMCTKSDPEGRETVMDLLPPEYSTLFSVGRLDYHTEGCLLLTNDGDLANALVHPTHHVPKVYEVKVQGELTEPALAALREGVFLDGRKTNPVDVIKLRYSQTGQNTWYQFVLTEGKNRQIHRMLEVVGFRVVRLRRVSMGPIELGNLPIGRYRTLNEQEVASLRNAAGMNERGRQPRQTPRSPRGAKRGPQASSSRPARSKVSR
jgi:pseudouridine synthase